MQNPYLPANNDDAIPQALRRRITFSEQPPVLLSFGTGFPHKIRFRKRVRAVASYLCLHPTFKPCVCSLEPAHSSTIAPPDVTELLVDMLL